MINYQPIMRGVDAALGVGEYEDCETYPKNPYEPGTQDAMDWDEGFSIGTDYLIYQW